MTAPKKYAEPRNIKIYILVLVCGYGVVTVGL